MSGEKPGLRARIVAELKKTFVVFVYLAVFLVAFTTYRRLLLAEYRIPFFHYGYSLVEALVLAKVIVLGSVLRIGERFRNRPLIVPTLVKTLGFSVLVLVFSFLEHLVVGWLHGKATGVIFNEFLDQGTWEILAQSFVKFLAILPLIAVGEVDRVLGEGKLFELFFRRGAGQPDTASEPA
jgi:hypothetical protein